MQKLVNASSTTRYLNSEKEVKINQKQNQQVVQTQKSSKHENPKRESKDSNPTLQENQQAYQDRIEMNQLKLVQYHEQ